MRRVFFLLSLCACVVAGDRAFIEVTAERTTVFVSEPVRIRLRIGVDAAFLKDNVLQPFQNDLDVPLQVTARWLRELKGAQLRPQPAPKGSSFALNGDVAHARVEAEGANAVLVIEQTFLPTQAGALTLEAPRLRYVYGTKFRNDFVQGRVAVDRHDATVTGAPLTITVKPLPERAPPHFGGGVGTFTLQARFNKQSVAVGELVKLVLTIRGDGNLEAFDTPRLDALKDFHVYGTRDDRGAAVRTITYEITALRVPAEMWSIPFSFFDPREANYVMGMVPVPLEVTGGDAETVARPPSPPSDGFWFPWIFGVVAVIIIATIARRRRANHRPPDAAEAFAARADEDLAAAFTEYLAAQLGCAPAAAITPELAQRLEACGVPTDLAERCAAMIEDLVGARYGGESSTDRAAAEALVTEIRYRV